MKNVLCFSFSLVMILLSYTSCSDTTKVEGIMDESTQPNLLPQDNIGIDLLKTFSEKVNKSKTKSFSFSDVQINKIENSSVSFKANQANQLTKATSIDSVTIPLITYTFEKDGNPGFAIVSPDEKVNKVLFYCENGRLADTSNFQEAAFLIRCIPNMIVNELNDYYMQPKTKTVIIDGVLMDEWNLPACIKTKWGYNTPYNNNYTAFNCSSSTSITTNGKYPASATAVAMAQCVANYPFPPEQLTKQYNVASFISKGKITANDKDAPKVAKLVKLFDTEFLHTKFACNRTQTLLANARVELSSLGFIEGQHFVYTSKENDIKTQMYLQFQCPTIYEASTKTNVNKTYTWIVDGMWFYLDSSMKKIQVNGYHCNWGIDGQYDSWYGSPFYPKYGPLEKPLFSPAYDVYPHFLHFRPVCDWCVLPPGF